jgi:RNA polymerase sigma-70 factor (ECF subfamily)
MAVAARVAEPAPSVAAEDDAALVGRVCRGDGAALGQLYDRHAPTLLATAIRVLGADREATDVLHDVFLEAWSHAKDYDESRGSVRTWLLIRLRSRALDRMGRAESTRTHPLHECGAAIDGATVRRTSPADCEDRLAVRHALGQIESDVREVLDLTYFGGFTAREIAERLGVPLGTVKSRLARGLGVLGALLRGGAHD